MANGEQEFARVYMTAKEIAEMFQISVGRAGKLMDKIGPTKFGRAKRLHVGDLWKYLHEQGYDDPGLRARLGGLPELAPIYPVPKTGGVYAVRGVAGYVKIGRARNIASRMCDLQVGHPERLELVAILSSDVRDEGSIQARWNHLRSSGEWFEVDDEMDVYLREARWS